MLSPQLVVIRPSRSGQPWDRLHPPRQGVCPRPTSSISRARLPTLLAGWRPPLSVPPSFGRPGQQTGPAGRHRRPRGFPPFQVQPVSSSQLDRAPSLISSSSGNGAGRGPVPAMSRPTYSRQVHDAFAPAVSGPAARSTIASCADPMVRRRCSCVCRRRSTLVASNCGQPRKRCGRRRRPRSCRIPEPAGPAPASLPAGMRSKQVGRTAVACHSGGGSKTPSARPPGRRAYRTIPSSPCRPGRSWEWAVNGLAGAGLAGRYRSARDRGLEFRPARSAADSIDPVVRAAANAMF